MKSLTGYNDTTPDSRACRRQPRMPARPMSPLVLSLLILASCNAPASQPPSDSAKSHTRTHDDAADFNPIRQNYYLAVEGDTEALDNSLSMIHELPPSRANEPLCMAYHGSLLLLRASKTVSLKDKERLTREGLTRMDQAVEAAPEDVEVRFVRGMSSVNLPAFMRRRALGDADVAWVAGRAMQAVESGKLPPALAAAALTHDGRRLKRQGQHDAAVEAWRLAVLIAPESRAARDATKRIEAAGDAPK